MASLAHPIEMKVAMELYQRMLCRQQPKSTLQRNSTLQRHEDSKEDKGLS